MNETIKYHVLMDQLNSSTNTPKNIVESLKAYSKTIYKSDLEKIYSAPMLGIGIYIATASLFCILAMVADLLHGHRSKKRWFPNKYFPINAFTLAEIAVAMKLPMDLSGSMPGTVDQLAKQASMAFLCVMMANFLPCLATMDSIELLTNVTALGVLVITLVVNVCIQIHTGVVGTIPNGKALEELESSPDIQPKYVDFLLDLQYTAVAIIYVVLLLLLLIIHVSSSLANLKSKQIIEHKYQQAHKTASKDLDQFSRELLTVETLKQHLSKYWIMAGSGNPQFIAACSATTTASGVICGLTALLHFLIILSTLDDIRGQYKSDYEWSTLVILIVQSIGVVLGTVAPSFRCFAPINFKLSGKSIRNHIIIFKVEKYWFQKLSDWKYGSISLPLLNVSLPFGNRILEAFVRSVKNLILNLCIVLQVLVVVVCKIIALVFFLVMICFRSLKWLLRVACLGERDENLELRNYVLQLEDGNMLAESTLRNLLKSLDGLIQKSEKKKPKNLKKLLEKSTDGFQGVRMFGKDNHQDCWSLAVVTLTTIAITLPNIDKGEVKRLLKSVREGLKYVTLVEETLDAPDDYRSVQKAAKTLWEEVDFRHRWLGIKLKDISSEVNTTSSSQVDTKLKIVQLFFEKAENKIKEEKGSADDESKTSICANSMSRVTETIISNKESHNNLFDELSSMITDIMAACLTNLPQAITKKCHTSVIEKREESLKAAAKLLGETKDIISTLQGLRQDKWCAYSRMPIDDLPFINKWRAHLSEP